jgi:hypothetical protein
MEILEQLDRDLSGLLVSLAAYERSDHPERFEAVRWHLPILEEHVRTLGLELAGESESGDEQA